MTPVPSWTRFRRALPLVAALGAALALVALVYLRAVGPPMPWQARVAVGMGVFATMLLAGVLMALLFTSARSGHDDRIEPPLR